MARKIVSLKITSVGTSLGLTLPDAVLVHLKAGEGDTVFLIPSPEGFLLTTMDPEFVEEMAAGRKFMRKRRKMLGDLGRIHI